MVAMSNSPDPTDLPSAGSREPRKAPESIAAAGTPDAVGSRPSRVSGARKRAVPKAAAKPSQARRRGSTPTTAPLDPPAPAFAAGGPQWSPDRPWPMRGRGTRALYNRRIQRVHERWPLVTRLGAALLSRPDLVLGLVGKRPPVERDGRVLNRSIQALLEVTNRLEGLSDGPGNAQPAPDPAVLRAQLTRMARAAMPIRTDVHVAGRIIPGPAGAPPIPIRVYRRYGAGIGPASGRHGRPPAIVYFHGGGWVTGDLDSHDGSCRLLAAVSGCIVVAIGYRLAPEDPFPAAVDDALAAYVWVHRHSAELGCAAGQVGVMGDSAGGNLAAVVALETRSGVGSAGPGVPPPVAQGLIYPAVDARLDTASMRTMSEGFFLTFEGMEYFRQTYLPERADWETPRASPLLADDHHGLAPALIVTAGFDPLRDDGVNYAEALAKAGVEVEYRCYDDQVHGFFGMGLLTDSLALATEVCDAMGRLMRRSVAVDQSA